MYATLLWPLAMGLAGGGFLFVGLVASIVPVDGSKLWAPIRVARFPFRRGSNGWDPTARFQIAVPFTRATRDSLRAWRLSLVALVLGSQLVQLRSATDTGLAATTGSAALAEAIVEWLLMLAWITYVVVAFRRAAQKS
ncbi:MAG TPA: hypothetical protein VIK06_07820 [Candidatus Limnocylindrales bacterium]